METQKFNEIVNRLLNVNQDVLDNIAKRMSNGEIVKPSTEDESACFQLIHDLDHIDGKVSGSITSRRYMHSEIWSLIEYLGAPVCCPLPTTSIQYVSILLTAKRNWMSHYHVLKMSDIGLL